MTDEIVEHLRTHDVGTAKCGAQMSDIFSMWGEEDYKYVVKFMNISISFLKASVTKTYYIS